MFDIGFPELALVSVVALLVLGPERLPETLRSLGLWLGRLRRSFARVKTEIEREIGMDEVRRQLHNEAVMEQMKQIERDARGMEADLRALEPAATNGPVGGQAAEPEAPCEPPPAAASAAGAMAPEQADDGPAATAAAPAAKEAATSIAP